MTLARARTAVGAAFLAQGLVFISLTTRLPRLQDRWDLDELGLSALLLMMVLLAGNSDRGGAHSIGRDEQAPPGAHRVSRTDRRSAAHSSSSRRASMAKPASR